MNNSMLLYLQKDAAILSLFGALLVIGVVAFVIRSTARPADDYHKAKDKVYKLRKSYFIGLILILTALFIFSFQFLPYYSAKHKHNVEVSVVGQQWAWMMKRGTLDMDSIKTFIGGSSIDLPVDKDIQFSVTSRDVNHNFAIYNPKGHIVAEVQAMPEYENKLEYTFHKKGTYKVVCLEYCGLAHAMMVGQINVK